MCQNVPPLEIYDDELYNMLRPTWQNAITRVCVRLHKYGDGALTEEWLRSRVLSKRRWDEFVALMLQWRWLRRDPETGNLCRAGLLAHVETEEDRPARSAEAVRVENGRQLRLDARITRLERAAGLTLEQAETEQIAPKIRTETAARRTNQAREAEHGPNTGMNGIIINSSPIGEINSNSNSKSEGPGTDLRTEPEQPAHESKRFLHMALPEAPQSSDVVRALHTAGFTDAECGKILKSYPISSIVDGIQCLADGAWPDSKNDRTTLQSYFRGKLGLNKRWKALRDEVAAGQVSAVMSVPGGAGEPLPAAGSQTCTLDRPRPLTEAEIAAAEEARRKVMSEIRPRVAAVPTAVAL